MKKSFKALPVRKQKELARITEIIKGVPGVEMAILFGSHARGDWVEDERVEKGITYTYQSDFDLLVIFRHISPKRAMVMEGQIEALVAREGWVKTWVSVMVHPLDFVNARLSKGQYFFTDIKKEGLALFDSGRCKLAKARTLSPAEREGLAEADFKEWYISANRFFSQFQSALKKRWNKLAAFELHQAVERYYSAILLVLTRYKPKTHDLKKLSRLAASQDNRLIDVFPKKTLEQIRCFNLLRAAYVEARYNASYKIKKVELSFLATCVNKLKNLSKRICKEKINSFSR